MSNVLFDFQGADALNRLVQLKIASHLFLVCNYNPKTFMLISEDAKFIQGVANLYKFSIDASLIKRIRRIDNELGGKINKDYHSYISSLENNLEVVNCLRTFACHNNNQNEINDKTEAWLISVIHKKQFETVGDYEVALSKLKSIGDSIFENVKKLIELMVKEYDHVKLIDVFQKQIFLFYKENSRIIKDELRNAYKSQISSREEVSDRVLGIWCKKLYVDRYKEQIDYLSSFIPKSKGEQKEKLQEKISQLQLEMNTVEELVVKQKGKSGAISPYDYLEFYCDAIEDKCLNILPDIRKQGITMLPQDMIQVIIFEDFKIVSITS